jgi:hypothetical protein
MFAEHWDELMPAGVALSSLPHPSRGNGAKICLRARRGWPGFVAAATLRAVSE